MRISDWSSDVCSADLQQADAVAQGVVDAREALLRRRRALRRRAVLLGRRRGHGHVASRTALRNWRVRSSFGALKRSSRSEEHTSELQSLMRNSYAVFCLKKKKKETIQLTYKHYT